MSDTVEIPSDDLAAPAEPERVDIDALLTSVGLRHHGFDAYAHGRVLGMTDRVVKFSIGLLSGMSATAAAKAAGYPGTGNVLRSKASKAARSKAVQEFLRTARDHKAAPLAAVDLTDREKLERLAEMIRSPGTSQANKIRAVQAHSQLRTDMDRAARVSELDGDPIETLRDIARISPLAALVAEELARLHGIEFRSADALALPADEAAKRAAVRQQLEARLHNGPESA